MRPLGMGIGDKEESAIVLVVDIRYTAVRECVCSSGPA